MIADLVARRDVAPQVYWPALDNQALAHSAALNLVELTRSLDPRFPAQLGIEPRTGEQAIHLMGPAELSDAAALADRLGLAEHTWHPDAKAPHIIHHEWVGAVGGFRARIFWLDKSGGEW